MIKNLLFKIKNHSSGFRRENKKVNADPQGSGSTALVGTPVFLDQPVLQSVLGFQQMCPNFAPRCPETKEIIHSYLFLDDLCKFELWTRHILVWPTTATSRQWGLGLKQDILGSVPDPGQSIRTKSASFMKVKIFLSGFVHAWAQKWTVSMFQTLWMERWSPSREYTRRSGSRYTSSSQLVASIQASAPWDNHFRNNNHKRDLVTIFLWEFFGMRPMEYIGLICAPLWSPRGGHVFLLELKVH